MIASSDNTKQENKSAWEAEIRERLSFFIFCFWENSSIIYTVADCCAVNWHHFTSSNQLICIFDALRKKEVNRNWILCFCSGAAATVLGFVSVCSNKSDRDRKGGFRGEKMLAENKTMHESNWEWVTMSCSYNPFFVGLLPKIETPLSALDLSLSLPVSDCVAECFILRKHAQVALMVMSLFSLPRINQCAD